MSEIPDDGPDGMLAYQMAIRNPNRDDPNWPLPSFDARDWAQAFVDMLDTHPEAATDKGTMVGWFANALMRGYDEAVMRMADAKENGE